METQLTEGSEVKKEEQEMKGNEIKQEESRSEETSKSGSSESKNPSSEMKETLSSPPTSPAPVKSPTASRKYTSIQDFGLTADQNARHRRKMEDAHFHQDGFSDVPHRGFFFFFNFILKQCIVFNFSKNKTRILLYLRWTWR